MQCANDKRAGCHDSQQAYVLLFVPRAGFRTVLLKPLQSPYSQLLNFSTKAAEVSVTSLPCKRSFPTARATIQHGSQFFGNRFTNIHTVRYTGGYFSNSLFSCFDHSCDILRINNTNTSSETRVSLSSRP